MYSIPMYFCGRIAISQNHTFVSLRTFAYTNLPYINEGPSKGFKPQQERRAIALEILVVAHSVLN